MDKRFLVIELGDQFTKICVRKGSVKSSTIVDAFIYQNPAGAINDGIVNDVVGVAKLIRANMITKNIKGVKDVHFVCCSPKVILREVVLPATNPKNLKNLVNTNASEYFPIDVSGYYFSHKVLENLVDQNNALRVMITAIPKVVIKGIYDLAQEAGLTIKSIDSETNAQYNLLVEHTPADKNILYFSIDQTTSIATFMKGKQLLMQRNLPIGGEDTIVAAIVASGLDISRDDYENDNYLDAIKKMNDETWLSEILTDEELELAVARIISAIERSIELFYSSKKNIALDAVVLTGTYGVVTEIRDYIEKAVGIPCHFIHSIENKENRLAEIDYVSFYFSCLGGVIAPLDFTPDELSKATKKSNNESENLNVGICLLVVAILASLVTVFLPYLELLDNEKRLDTMNSELEQYAYVVDIHDEYQIYKEANDNLQVFVDRGFNDNQNLVPLLEEFEEKLPNSILFLSITCRIDGFDVNVSTKDYEEAAVTLSAVRGFETIDITEISPLKKEIKETESGQEVERIAFSFSCSYKSYVEEMLAKSLEEDTAE